MLLKWLFSMLLFFQSFQIQSQDIKILQIGDSHTVPGITLNIVKDSLISNNFETEIKIYAKNGKSYSYFISNISTVKSYINSFNPNIIIISLGTNDCFGGCNKESFKKTVKKLIDSIKTVYDTNNILLTSPPYNKKYDNMVECSLVLKEVSLEYNNVYFCDILEKNDLYKKYIGKDRVHYSNIGYKIHGQIIFDFINKNILQ